MFGEIRRSCMVMAVLCAPLECSFGQAVTTAFTYQGQLKEGGAPYDGDADFRFQLFSAAMGGAQVGPTRDVLGVSVNNGLFSVELDFGAVFNGDNRWLSISVRPVGDPGYTPLTPRVKLTATPYSSHALDTQKLRGRTISTTAPASGEILKFDGAQWAPGSVSAPNGHALDAADGSPTNVVFANNAGKVGINTIDAETSLTVQSFSTDALRLLGPGALGSTARLHFGDASYVYLEEDDDDYLTIYSIQRTALMGGNVGIHTLSPTHTLTVQSAMVETLRLIGPTSSFGYNARLNFGDENYVYLQEDADDRLTIFANQRTAIQGGNVGIGTLDPAAKLDVVGSLAGGIGVYARAHGPGTTNVALRANNSHSGGIGIFSTSSSTDANLVVANSGTGDLVRGFSGPSGGNLVFRVENNGKATVSVLTITGGADLAEPFAVSRSARLFSEPIEPGSVMVIDPDNPGRLKLSDEAYDRKVAGVISGAKGLAPGMVMSAQGSAHADGDHPVALTGRVWCRCDAASGSIQPGDLLTTAGRPGHAMKVDDYVQAQGAILGKAMSSLDSGTGLVLVLVSLQ